MRRHLTAQLYTMCFYRLALGLVLLAAMVLPATAQKLQLTAEEQAWLGSHGPVKVVVGAAIEPFYRTAASDGKPIGYAIDVMQLLAQRAGLKIEYVKADTTRAGLQALRDGSADMTVIMRMNTERKSFVVQTGALVPAESVFITRKGDAALSFTDFLQGRRIAVAADSTDDERLTREQPQATLVRFPGAGKAIQAVAAGEADAMLSELHSAVWFIEANLLSNLQVRRIDGAARETWGPAVRASLPLLVSIMAKAMDSLTPQERAELARRWLPRGSAVSFVGNEANLSAAERDWVARSGEVRAGFDARFFPFTQARALGGFEGLGADMLRAAMGKVGLRLVSQEGGSFAQTYDRALKGEVNVVVGMARNPVRSAVFDFVGPFSSSPTVIVTRYQGGLRIVGDLADLGQARVGLLAQHFLIAELRSRLPALQLVEFPSQEASLNALVDGQLEAVVANAHVVSRLLQSSFAGQLRVAGVVRDADSDLYLGVPKTQPELARVLAQGFAALTPTELSEIRQRWLLVRIEPGVQWKDLLAWGVPLLIATLAVLSVLLVANRRLRVANTRVEAARQAAEAAVAVRGRFLAYLAHEVRGGVRNVAVGVGLLRSGDITAHNAPTLWRSVEQSAEQLGSVLDATLDSEHTLIQGVQLRATPTTLLPWWQGVITPLRQRAQASGLTLLDTPPLEPLTPRMVDTTRLAQVLANLVGNAIKFTPSGQVQVHAQWFEDQGLLRVQVQDQGPGLSAQDRASLFQPYVQGQAGKAAGSGAGLGLAISQEIAHAMGGAITAPQPHLGPGSASSGAVFVLEVRLPEVPAQAPPPG
jgi:two-component system, NarL family, sensor histidine kinase EvgS